MTKGPAGTLLETPAIRAPRRAYRPFLFPRLEKIPRAQIDLVRRLEWMLPEGLLSGEIGEPVKQALKRVFDEDVSLWLDYVHAVPPRNLKKIMGDPTFLGVIAPTAHGARGLVEVDLVLAHAIIDLLLGAPGESAVARPLTEIEQGVLSYVLLETFKAFSSQGEGGESGHRVRLERIASSVEEGLALFADELAVAVIELKVLIGTATGYLRLHLPASSIRAAVPPENSPLRRAKRLQRLQANLPRLAGVRLPLRAEIGRAELNAGDIAALRAGDVMLVDELTTRADLGESGRAELRLGFGRAGKIEATLDVADGRYHATIESVVLGEERPPSTAEGALAADMPAERGEAPAPEPEPEEPDELDMPFERDADHTAITDLSAHFRRHPGGQGDDDVTDNDEAGVGADAAELLNDVPLQVVVELARVPITAEELVGLHHGKILDLGRAPGEPVDLSVNGKVVARGELVEVEGQLGVRIVSMTE